MLEELLANTGDMALKRRAKRIITELNPRPGEKIIDIGCGDGYYLHLLSNLGIKNLHLSGTDYDIKGLEKAKLNLHGKKIPIYRGNLMHKLPFKKSEFNKAVMSEVAEHLPDDVKGLKEVFRILKPGGVLCLTVPNANYPMLWDPLNWFLERLFGVHIKSGFFAGLWNQHIRLYNPEQIKQVVQQAGFRIEKVESLTFWCLPFNHYLVNLVARYLHNQFILGTPNASLNKFTTSPSRPFLTNLAFFGVNLLDHLNDIWQPKNTGVSVFVKAKKI
ncbi:MAG: group 1 glycosyl transferase [Microgenomates group bacterium Gr01-1014_16]|nr:MAG: group 1 glycosyl transferase [Microgenomates group bacterium Gr01-1014_16]